MVEVELKFQIPEARRNALLKALDAKKSQIIPLKAKYYDTQDGLLSQHGVALRQRLEGTRWVQTLKAAGKSHVHRFEHNYDLGELEDAPELDLIIYTKHAEAEQILKHALGDSHAELKLQFETDIQRTFRVMHFEDTEIEVSLDVGEVRTATAQHAMHEVEFELKSGSVHSLWLLVLNG